ncbi:MAG: hypothetical protein ABEH65_00510 [Halobacteriales archaeon]
MATTTIDHIECGIERSHPDGAEVMCTLDRSIGGDGLEGDWGE